GGSGAVRLFRLAHPDGLARAARRRAELEIWVVRQRRAALIRCEARNFATAGAIGCDDAVQPIVALGVVVARMAQSRIQLELPGAPRRALALAAFGRLWTRALAREAGIR